MTVQQAYWVMIGLAAVPIPALCLAWLALFRNSSSAGLRRIIIAALVTATYVWLLVGWKFPWVMGSSYWTRLIVIDINFLVAVSCFIGAFWIKGRIRPPLLLASLATTLLWGIVAGINVAV